MSEIQEPTELITGYPLLPRDEGERPDLQDHYVARLRRLLRLRQEYLRELNHEGLWLLDRCIFATYCDCVEIGAGLPAQGVLRSTPSPEGTGRTPIRPSRRSRRH